MECLIPMQFDDKKFLCLLQYRKPESLAVNDRKSRPMSQVLACITPCNLYIDNCSAALFCIGSNLPSARGGPNKELPYQSVSLNHAL